MNQATKLKKADLIIGLPRALLYFKYHQLWEVFFKELGFKILVSPETNRQILKDGVNLAVDESCLPVKIFLGHVNYLKDKADYIFLPRIVSLNKKEELCTKFMGLYDNVNNTFDGKINILEYNIDFHFFQKNQARTFFEVGMKLVSNPLKVWLAYRKALKIYDNEHLKLIQEQEQRLKQKNNKLKILIVAHPYVIHDGLIGSPISKFLLKENVEIFYADLVESLPARKKAEEISSDMYWTYNKEFLGAIAQYAKKINGIIYIAAFPCGPDALSIELYQKKFPQIPSMNLTLDELQSEAGLMTRLESFVDILNLRKKKNAKTK
jgi:predicted nucleotide-binding protein (sugar kinase/HSP70/actin superfamily)